MGGLAIDRNPLFRHFLAQRWPDPWYAGMAYQIDHQQWQTANLETSPGTGDRRPFFGDVIRSGLCMALCLSGESLLARSMVGNAAGRDS